MIASSTIEAVRSRLELLLSELDGTIERRYPVALLTEQITSGTSTEDIVGVFNYRRKHNKIALLLPISQKTWRQMEEGNYAEMAVNVAFRSLWTFSKYCGDDVAIRQNGDFISVECLSSNMPLQDKSDFEILLPGRSEIAVTLAELPSSIRIALENESTLN